jgi:hypothetical protein
MKIVDGYFGKEFKEPNLERHVWFPTDNPNNHYRSRRRHKSPCQSFQHTSSVRLFCGSNNVRRGSGIDKRCRACLSAMITFFLMVFMALASRAELCILPGNLVHISTVSSVSRQSYEMEHCDDRYFCAFLVSMVGVKNILLPHLAFLQNNNASNGTDQNGWASGILFIRHTLNPFKDKNLRLLLENASTSEASR